MRTTLKIFLVLAAVFAVAGSLIFFFKTKLSPPQPLADGNPHLEQAEQCVAKIQGAPSDSILNARFFEARHLLTFLADNGLLTDKDGDMLKTEMVERYAPLYADKCFGHFKESYWDEKVIQQIPLQIAVAKGVRLSDGESAVDRSKEAHDVLDEVLEVVCRYDSAKLLARGKTYQNWANTKRRLSRAQRFMNDEYLGCNIELVRSLDSLRYRLEKSHYAYLGLQSRRLAGYRSMDKEDYDSLCQVVDEEFRHYEDSAHIVYGIPQREEEVDSLRHEMMSNKTKASGYYLTIMATDKIVKAGQYIFEKIME